MKALMASVVAAIAASTCCLGPVVLSALGAGAMGAAATKLAPYRPWFLGLTVVLLGSAFYFTYRQPRATTCGPDGRCAVPSATRAARITLWVATVLVVLLVTFPYYVNWLL